MRSRLLAATAILAAVSASPAGAADHVWKFTTSVAETRLEAQQFLQFVKEVEEGTGGAIEIETYFNSGLGIDPADELRALRDGAVELGTPYYGYLGRDLPQLSVVVMQGALLDVASNLKVADTLRAIFAGEYEKWRVEIVGWRMGPIYDMSIFCKEPVNSLEALQGRKLRVWSREQVLAYEKLGVPALIMPQTELYSALQTGVIDCALYVVGNAKTISIHEVAPYAAQLHVYAATPEPVVVNDAAWQALTPEQQQVVLTAGENLWNRTLAAAEADPAKREQEVAAELTAAGTLTVLPPFSAEDKAKFFAAVSEVWEAEAEAIGPEAVGYREQVLVVLQGN